MSISIYKLHKVFYHELGHFVSGELNFMYFEGSGIAEIQIYLCNENNLEYCGHTKPILTNNVKEINEPTVPPIKRLAEYLAKKVYGCIFQSYYLNMDLSICLKNNGKIDVDQSLNSLISYKIGSINSEFFQKSIKHLDFLKSLNLLNSFMKLNPDIYLSKINETKFQVDLEKLRIDTLNLIKLHYPYYKKFVTEIQLIIDAKLKQS